MSSYFPSRRSVLTASVAGLTAASYQRILGANDRVRVANVGCGRRGLLKELIDIKDSGQLQVSAVCDAWQQKLDKAKAQVKEMTGQEPYATRKLADVLSRKDIDAVVIGTPDHLHCQQLIQAVQAGKDVYVEKPLAMNMEELIRAYDAVKKSGRIVQMGTQMRSYPQANGLKSFLADKKLGQILKIEQVRNGFTPYWMGYGGPEYINNPPTPQDVDWEAFRGEYGKKQFNTSEYQNWYGYREYSLGSHTNLMVHFIDLMHYVTPATFPKRVVALGETYRWKNEFDVQDSVDALFDYPEGFMVRYTTIFGNSAGNLAKWYGSLGTVDAKSLSARQKWVASGEGSSDPTKLASEVQMEEPAMVPHMQNFIECVRSRKQPLAPIEAGYAHSVAALMVEKSLTSGRRTTYDHARREILFG